MGKPSSKSKILLVDDTPSTIAMVRTALEAAGYYVFVATSGEKALKSAELTAPDLILLDILMPAMDGYETCGRLKAQDTTRDIPVIFMSALTSTFDKVKGFGLGAVDYVTKPIETEELLSRVNTHLTIRRLQQELVEANTRLEEKVSARTDELRNANLELRQEIIERTRAEESLVKINRAYRALSESNQAVIRATDEEELLQEACRIIFRDCGYRLVWIGLAEPDESKTVRPVAQAGFEEGYLDMVNIVWADTKWGRGPTGTAIRTGKPVIMKDVMRDPDYGPWRDEAAKRGYASSAAFPLIANGKALGALNLYADEPDAFDPEEIHLLKELAGDLAYGIQTLRLRQEHARTEEALRESEELHRITIEHILDPVFITDDEGRFTFICPNVFHILGYTVQEMEAMGNIAKLLGEDLFTHEELEACGEIRNIDGVITDKHGSERLYLVSVRRVSIKGGTILYTCHDITERKKAEETIRKAEEKYRLIYENLQDFYFEVLLDGTIVELSPSFETITGYPRSEILGKSIVGFCAGSEAHDPTMREVLQPGAVEVHEDRIRGEDGREFIFSSRSVLVCDEQGRPWKTCGTAREITKQKQAEQALRESEERYRTLFEESADAILIVRPEGEIVDVNPACAELLGAPKSELVGGRIQHYYWNPAERAAIRKTLDEGDFIRQHEWKIRRRDGNPRTCLLASSAWKDEEGNILAYLSIARDITESKRLEERLRQAQKMEAIGTLAGGIAHDFNNLLFVMTGNTELALDLEPADSELHGHLQEALKAAERATDLVRQILAFSRQRTTERTPVSVTPVVKEVVKFLRASIPTTIEIELYVDEDPGTIMADPTEIHQVLMNLCTNAAHSMRMHGGLLEVGLAYVEVDDEFSVLHDNIPPGPYARLTVSDTGHGISPEDLERIFEPYFTTKQRGEGTGLGLAVVHGIVRSYGGTISVYSEPGKGSTFRVYLPVQREAASTRADTSAQALPTGRETILVVDDEPPVTHIITGILKSLGYQVIPVNDPLEALDLFAARPTVFDLVISDMTMPKMTGIDLSKELMSIRPDIPVILCTGFSELVSKERAEKLGFRSFLMKPIRKKELAQTVYGALHTETFEED